MNNRTYLIVGVGLGATMIAFTWLLKDSPFSLSLERSLPFLVLIWTLLHAHLYLVILMLSAPPYLDHLVGYFLIFIQWLLVGFLASKLIGWIISSRKH